MAVLTIFITIRYIAYTESGEISQQLNFKCLGLIIKKVFLDISILYPLHTQFKNPKNPTEKLKTQDFCQLYNYPIYQGLTV